MQSTLNSAIFASFLERYKLSGFRDKDSEIKKESLVFSLTCGGFFLTTFFGNRGLKMAHGFYVVNRVCQFSIESLR